MTDRAKRLRKRLDIHARQILLQITVPPDTTITEVVADEDNRVTIVVNPANAHDPPSLEHLPGSWLSATEQLIWNSLEGIEPLVGKQIASKIGRDYEAKLKHVLQNLEERGVLLHEDGKGYSRAPMRAPR